MTEQQIQTKKIKELEADGYYVLKLIKTNKNGIPDVLALHPEYGIEFYEIKTKKGKASKLQEYRMKELRQYGFTAEIYRG
jgi:Holliday junction resolvase